MGNVIAWTAAAGLLLGLALPALGCGGDGAGPTGPRTGSIAGQVRNQDTGAPIGEARIETAPLTEAVLTDDQGRFTIGGVQPGSYTVMASKEGFAAAARAAVVLSGATATVDLSLSPAGNGTVIEVEVLNFSYQPATVNARVGDTIRWIQRDQVPHTVTTSNPAPTQPGGFDQTLDAPGDHATVQMTRAGTIAYFCRPHPFMTGSIVVAP